jgi:biotin carboxyl carrier protein
MKLNVKIGETNYEVDIEDLNTRPIVATVNGARVEVTPENGTPLPARRDPSAAPAIEKKPAAPSITANGNVLHAPLPGTVTEIFVKGGDHVESGQVVLVIEAMKMKNNIRSPREGKLAAVNVTAGQTVNHKEALLEFEA